MCEAGKDFWAFSSSSFRFQKLYDGQLLICLVWCLSYAPLSV